MPIEPDQPVSIELEKKVPNIISYQAYSTRYFYFNPDYPVIINPDQAMPIEDNYPEPYPTSSIYFVINPDYPVSIEADQPTLTEDDNPSPHP